jgi:hypothetical protein
VALDLSVAVDDSGEDLRAADVDTDDAFAIQTARLPYSPPGVRAA